MSKLTPQPIPYQAHCFLQLYKSVRRYSILCVGVSRLVSPKTVTHTIEGAFHKRFPYSISTLYDVSQLENGFSWNTRSAVSECMSKTFLSSPFAPRY